MKKMFKCFIALTLVICTLGSIIGGASAAGSPGGLVPPKVDTFSTIGNLPSKNRLSAIDLSGIDILISPTQNGKKSGTLSPPEALNYNGLDYENLSFWDKFNGYYEYTYEYNKTTKRGNGTIVFSAHWETTKYRDHDNNTEKPAVAEWSGTIPFTATAEMFTFFLVLPVVITWQEAPADSMRTARAARNWEGGLTVNYFITRDYGGYPSYKSYVSRGDKYQTTQNVEINARYAVGNLPYSDIDQNGYYTNALTWATQNGIASGVGGLRFAPDKGCTRAEIVSFLHKGSYTRCDIYGGHYPGGYFYDVKPTDWFKDAVNWAAKYKIATGYKRVVMDYYVADFFEPNNVCTRAQAITFIWRAAGSPKANTTNKFRDVSSSDYFYQAIMWALSKGVVNGTSSTTFSPNGTCTRAQIITMIYRARLLMQNFKH